MSAGGLKPGHRGHLDLCWGCWPVGAVSGQSVWGWKTLICYWKGIESRTLRGSNICRHWWTSLWADLIKSHRQKYTECFIFFSSQDFQFLTSKSTWIAVRAECVRRHPPAVHVTCSYSGLLRCPLRNNYMSGDLSCLGSGLTLVSQRGRTNKQPTE